ncbi:uncharacterized protein LOC113310942 isoform X3 [Papaver somniferum]|uniref:uncharacterized protein LOC113310942 isoform X3 n=1 Tax=Papaver somniferum TaxID=3469 RepID=UPI000E706030|nr:uncharacterized protein LOC113310942 isoform X3 [Papaver somniferum]
MVSDRAVEMEGSGAPDSPFRCIIVPRSRLLLEIPALPEILVLENPEQLQTCFQEFLDDYTRARQNKSSDPRKFADCEDTAGKHTHLMEWVFKALGAPEWDELKQYVVGLLDTLLMSSEENRLQFGKSGAVTLVVNALTSLESRSEERHAGFQTCPICAVCLYCRFDIIKI